MEKSISENNEIPSSTPDGDRCWPPLKLVVGLDLVLLAISLFVPTLKDSRYLTIENLANDWGIWLPVVQLLVLVIAGLLYGPPAASGKRRWLIAVNGLLIGLAGLFLFDQFEYVRHRFYELLLRITVAGLWGTAIIGGPFVLLWILQRRRGVRRSFPFARWWFASLLILAFVEPTAAVLQPKTRRLAIPAKLADPPAGELHVVALGGSTMVGYPYEPKFGIAEVAAHGLRRMYPHQKVVLHNLALPGLNLANAVAEMRRLTVRPQLLLLYSAHNEFYWDMEELMTESSSPFDMFDRWFRWSPSFCIVHQYLKTRVIVRPETHKQFGLISDPAASAEMRVKRLRRFRDQLRQLAEFCRREQIPTVWYVPAASESGFEPNRSCIAGTITPERKREIERIYGQARSAETAANWRSAASLYESALVRYPGFAEFHFRLGHCLSHLRKYGEARSHFQQALDDDGYPVRAITDYRDSIAQVAGEFDIPLIDSAKVLRPLTPHGILDRSLFHDNVHPTLKAFHALGTAALTLISRRHLLDSVAGPPQTVEPEGLFATTAALKITRGDLVSAYRRIAAGLNHLGILRFDETGRKREADRYQSMADRLEHGDINPGDEGTEPLRQTAAD